MGNRINTKIAIEENIAVELEMFDGFSLDDISDFTEMFDEEQEFLLEAI